MLPSFAVNNYYIILNVNSRHRLHYVWFQNNPGQVNIWVCILYSVNSNAYTTPVRIFGKPYAHKLCAVDIFWNVTHRQAISLLPSFMIQWAILIFIKCLSTNQNQLYCSMQVSINIDINCHSAVILDFCAATDNTCFSLGIEECTLGVHQTVLTENLIYKSVEGAYFFGIKYAKIVLA